MKTLLTLFLSSIFANVTSAQIANQNKVPDKITSYFHDKYPSSERKKWVFKNDVYIIKFISNNKTSISTFDTSGLWKSTETQISSTRKLPLAVKNGFFKSKFSSWFIETIAKYETPETTTYKFVIDNGTSLDGDHHDAFLQKHLIEFSGDGRLLNKTVVN